MAKKKKSRPTSLKLREVLPRDQQRGLSDSVLNMTGKDIQDIVKTGKIDEKTRKELLSIAVKRVNCGQTLFPYSSMDFSEKKIKKGDPQW